jgi:hypothetical protein
MDSASLNPSYKLLQRNRPPAQIGVGHQSDLVAGQPYSFKVVGYGFA